MINATVQTENTEHRTRMLANRTANIAKRRIAIRSYLERIGHQVADAGGVDEAIATAESLQPEVLVCDWNLSERRDGIDAARILQAKYGLAVIFVTAYELGNLRPKIQGIDPVDCLHKPISLAELNTRIQAIVAPEAI